MKKKTSEKQKFIEIVADTKQEQIQIQTREIQIQATDTSTVSATC